MRLMILEERRLRDTMSLNGESVVIGSSPDCDIHLPDTRLGAKQARITRDKKGDWWLEVLEFAVPTRLNRAVQKKTAKLRHADEIEIGIFAIRVFEESTKSREEIGRERLQALAKSHGAGLPLDTIMVKDTADLSITRDHLEQITILAMRLAQLDSVRQVLPPVLKALIRAFDARRAWMAARPAGKHEFQWTLGQTDKGEPCERPAFSVIAQARCLEHTKHICVANAPNEGVGSAMAVPLVGQTGNVGILCVENDTGDPPYNRFSLDALKAMAGCIALPIETIIRKSSARRIETASAEHVLARTTQDAVTPRALPQWDELQVAVFRHLGAEHCSDFYDIVQLRDRTAAIVLAKVTAESRLLPRFFAELRAAFRSAVLYSEAPHLFARSLNWILQSGNAKKEIDLAAAWICPKTGLVRYCLAGRSVLLARILADGVCEMADSNDAPSIGRVRAPAFEGQTLELAEGDSLALATDGVLTARNARQEYYGLEGLKETICDGLGDTPSHVLNEFATELTEFISGGAAPEDITIALLRRE